MNWLISSIVAMVCWGIWSVFMKLASKYLNWQQTFVITSIATLGATLAIFIFLKPKINFHSIGFTYALLAGVVGSLALIAFYSAMKVGKSIIVVPLTALYPIITVLLSYFFLHEEISFVKGVGIVLALAAILLVSIN